MVLGPICLYLYKNVLIISYNIVKVFCFEFRICPLNPCNYIINLTPMLRCYYSLFIAHVLACLLDKLCFLVSINYVAFCI